MTLSKIGTEENTVKDEVRHFINNYNKPLIYCCRIQCLKLINNLKKRKIDQVDTAHVTLVYSATNTSPFKRRKILSPFKQDPSNSQLSLKSPGGDRNHKPITTHSLKFSDLKTRTPKHKTATVEPKRSKRHEASVGQSWSTNSTPARPALIATKELAGRTIVKSQFKTVPLHESVVQLHKDCVERIAAHAGDGAGGTPAS